MWKDFTPKKDNEPERLSGGWIEVSILWSDEAHKGSVLEAGEVLNKLRARGQEVRNRSIARLASATRHDRLPCPNLGDLVCLETAVK